jgi:hypothetical protein
MVSLDLLEKRFACDLSQCKGDCCVIGDSGAPLEEEERELIEKNYPVVEPYLSDEGRSVIRKSGLSLIDSDGDLVTPLVDGKECAFTIFENGIAFCAFEKLWTEGVIIFRKPVSCHLYPVRLSKYRDYIAVNYEQWSRCKPAVATGENKGIPLYVFLKNALVRKFGAGWYGQLEKAAIAWNENAVNRKTTAF